MAIWEKFGSRDRTLALQESDNRATLIYIIDQTSSDVTAMDTAEFQTPVSFRGLTRDSISIEQIGPSLFEAEIEYLHPDAQQDNEKPDTGEVVVSFDTTGGTTHVTQSNGTTSYAAVGDVAPDFKSAIGVNDNSVEGVDVVIPSLKLQLTTKFAQGTITDSYVKTVASLTGKTNDATFKSYNRGELLFLGGNGTARSNGDSEVTFYFEAQANAENISVGDITVTEKKGHQYLWVHYRSEEDGAANAIVQQPFAAYVEEVYEEGDFSQLGIGI